MSNGEQKPGNPDDRREEASLEEKLEHLRELYLKVRTLRATIPKTIAPLPAKQYSSPDALFSSFRRAVGDGSKEISEAKAALTSGESKKMLEEADGSRKTDPKGIRPWRATDYPNWTTPATKI
ncbi:hypothetical protein GE09DRAFT_92087 [Coniochaeta sp. 2T2.1]|nr:hypothetical protein GE09DRAFT_92087 [Coniochaeta sp. 2T2.1]